MSETTSSSALKHAPFGLISAALGLLIFISACALTVSAMGQTGGAKMNPVWYLIGAGVALPGLGLGIWGLRSKSVGAFFGVLINLAALFALPILWWVINALTIGS